MIHLFSIPLASANGMMGTYGMMTGSAVAGPFFGTLVLALVLIDLVLLGIWLFQKISKK